MTGVLDASPKMCVLRGASGGVNSFLPLRSRGCCSVLVCCSVVGLVLGVVCSDLYTLDKSKGSSLVRLGGLVSKLNILGDDFGMKLEGCG